MICQWKYFLEDNDIFGSTENVLTKLTSDIADRIIIKKSENSVPDSKKAISNSDNHIDDSHNFEKHNQNCNRSSSVSISNQTNTLSTDDVSPIDGDQDHNPDRDMNHSNDIKTRINNDIANNYTVQTNHIVVDNNTKYTDQPYDTQDQANHILKKDQQVITMMLG